MICVDSTFLGLILHPAAAPPTDPTTGQSITRLQDRLDYLLEGWAADKEKVAIPTNVLSEFLVLAAGDSAQYLDDIDTSSNFIILPFDQKAAVELAAIQIANRAAMSKTKQKQVITETKAKLNFDRQIVAIAKSNQIATIYSDDEGFKTFAEENGLEVIQTWTLPLPPAVLVPLPFDTGEQTHEEADTITADDARSIGESSKDQAAAARVVTDGDAIRAIEHEESDQSEKPEAAA